MSMEEFHDFDEKGKENKIIVIVFNISANLTNTPVYDVCVYMLYLAMSVPL